MSINKAYNATQAKRKKKPSEPEIKSPKVAHWKQQTLFISTAKGEEEVLQLKMNLAGKIKESIKMLIEVEHDG